MCLTLHVNVTYIEGSNSCHHVPSFCHLIWGSFEKFRESILIYEGSFPSEHKPTCRSNFGCKVTELFGIIHGRSSSLFRFLGSLFKSFWQGVDIGTWDMCPQTNSQSPPKKEIVNQMDKGNLVPPHKNVKALSGCPTPFWKSLAKPTVSISQYGTWPLQCWALPSV